MNDVAEMENIKTDFQFAPGSVKYNSNFLAMYKNVVNAADYDKIFFLLVRFLDNVFTEVRNITSLLPLPRPTYS